MAGPARAVMAASSGGPPTNASSCRTASSANAATRRSAAGTSVGHSARMHEPTGGITMPHASASTI